MKRKRAVIVLLSVLLILFVAVPLLLKLAFPEPRLRAMILPRASEALGRPVECGRIDLSLGWHGLGLRLRELSLGADESGYGLRSIHLPQLEADLAWRALLRGEISVRTLRFEEPEIELLLPPPGYQAPARPARSDSADSAASPAIMAVAAPDVRVKGGVLVLNRKGGPLLRCEIPEARLATTVAEGGDVSLSARLDLDELQMKQGDLLSVRTKARLEVEAQLRGDRLELERCLLGLREMEITAAQPPAAEPLRLRGGGFDMELSGDALISDLIGPAPDPNALHLTAQMELRDLSLVPDPEGFGLRECAIPRIRAELSWPSSRQGEISLGHILIEEPRLELLLPRVESEKTSPGIEGAKGSRRRKADPPAAELQGGSEAAAAPPAAGAALAALAVAAPDITLERGFIRVRQEDGPEIELELPSGRIAGTWDELGALSLTADLDLDPIRLKETDRLDGKTSAELDLALRMTDGRLEIDDGVLHLAALQLSIWPPPPGEAVELRGGGAELTLSGSAPLAALSSDPLDLDALSAGAELVLRAFTLEGPSLAKPMQLLETRIRGDMQRLELQSLQLRSGSSQLELSGEIEGLREPRMRLDLRSSGLDLTDFLVTAREDAASEAEQAPKGEEASIWPAILLPGSLDFRIARLRTKQAIFEDVSGQLLVDKESIRVRGMSARLFEGEVQGEMLLRPDEQQRVHCEGEFQVDEVQAPAFLAAFTPIKNGVAGNLSSEFDFEMKLAPGERPQGFDLDAELDLKDGVLDNPPALHALFRAAGLATRESYDLGRLHQLVQLRQDRVITENLRLPLDDGELRGAGSTGLDGSLDYRGTWVIGPRSAARLDKGSPLRLLADEQGRIHIDFYLKGDLKHPRVTLDQRAIEERLRQKAEEKLKEEGQQLIKKGLDDLKKFLKN